MERELLKSSRAGRSSFLNDAEEEGQSPGTSASARTRHLALLGSLWLGLALLLAVDLLAEPVLLTAWFTIPALVGAIFLPGRDVRLLALGAVACAIASGWEAGILGTTYYLFRVGATAVIAALSVFIAAKRDAKRAPATGETGGGNGSADAGDPEDESAGKEAGIRDGQDGRPLAFERRKKRDLPHDAGTQIRELELLTRRLIQIQEQQQQTVSRELHDNVAQVLTAVTNRITLARTSGANLPAWLIQELFDLQENLDGALTDIRTLAREMRPSLLDHCGFAAALEKHTRDFRERTGVDFELDIDADAAAPFDNENLTHLFRLAQEALQNIEEHSGASRAWLRLARKNGEMHLEIGDNGCSFTEARIVEAQRDGHLGLLGMRERAELLGGDFILEANPPRGTTIRVSIPVPPRKIQT